MNKPWNSYKQGILPVLTFVVLLLLIVIQVSWISRAAHLEEQNFNHRVSMALNAARDEIGHRAPLCNDMTDFLCGRECAEKVHQVKQAEIDSIIHACLHRFHIDLPYTFDISDSLLHQGQGLFFTPACYRQNLNGLIDQDGIQIKLQFPTRNQFLIAELWSQLGLSIVFILFVMLSFLIMWRLFRREKALMVRTSDFVNNMVHEFQTPIANIRFASNLLKRLKGDQTAKTEEYTQVILNETQRLQAHVEAVLRVASGEESRGQTEVVRVHELIDQVLHTFQYRMDELGASCSLSKEARFDQIEAEQGHLSLVLSNLIDNALKYVKQAPRIEIHTLNKEGQLLVRISDNGIGIARADQDRIFDKHFRVSTGNVHNVKGFGLGLTYVKKVVEQYGGSIKIESSMEKGSTFILTFPLSQRDGQDKENTGH